MLNQQIYEEASEWFVRMRDGEDSAPLRADLMTWLLRSPEHVKAYLDIAAIWSEVQGVAADSDLDLATRIARARADRNVSTFAAAIQPHVEHRTRHIRWLAVAACLVIVLAGTTLVWWRYGPETYSTALGEQRSIPLADGSSVELNSGSLVRIRYSEDYRNIELLRGQALFRVAKDAKRPFTVRGSGMSVRAVGTIFDVYEKRDSEVVTVVEGAVEVARATNIAPAQSDGREGSGSLQAPMPSTPAPLTLSAGKQVVVAKGSAAEPRPVNVAAAVAWTQRQLVFEFTPLAEVVDEFNRYNARKLVIEGAQLRDFKISAIFKSTDSASFIRFAATMPGVQVRQTPNTIVISAERN